MLLTILAYNLCIIKAEIDPRLPSKTMAKILFGQDPKPENICINECQYL